MLFTQPSLTYIFISLFLYGCSSENSTTDTQKASDGKKIEKLLKQTSNQPPSLPEISTQTQDDSQKQASALPTRSELRVISEQAKALESKAKNVIEQFDDNLNNHQARKEAETQFKNMLPEYKEKMLQIGKARLKEANR
ncbi:hypothetical protein [Methylobacter sp. S3L5C]|uniref:hypothetical protein n=1 Tax=Methylobacter sp. S3L5C TaxID=2839024 RepID=UPI001FAD6502|nr:hypothetical protein [Methylobacter sp. S3L5C]UOA08749.1 hypothetical protein KKZ03_00010 [Methylobacter sp. S3L5C]